MTNSDLTLVLGGNGKTGRRVAQRLRALDRPVRIGSRAGDPPFDWTDRATWPGSLAGVHAAYLTYQPDLAFPGAAEAVGDYAALAAASGVRRLVLLSGRGEDGALAGEKAVAAAGVEWAVVRSAFFMQNFTEDFLAGPVEAGEIALPAGDVPEPFVDADDIADVAVAALLGTIPLDRVYEVTGPRSLTFGEVAAEIAAASGRPVRYVPVSRGRVRRRRGRGRVPGPRSRPGSARCSRPCWTGATWPRPAGWPRRSAGRRGTSPSSPRRPGRSR